ncbi:proline--tRNA ligase [bacterium]|nr:proline--tRNA ligase [bacterium]
MAKQQKTAITPTRAEDYPEWYQQVIKGAELAENSPVRGCMVIKPWGYGIWERLQRQLDDRIKATGHENAYFPLLIPLSFMEREAEHVEGFAKECAVVTHHRLEERDGKLHPAGELEEPMIIRPTSETIIGDTFAKWVQSYRDLPLLINQWANVMRWEMRTRLFLRTSEFLWQEGHTVHATEEEAVEETLKMLEVYRELAEEVVAMPVIVGEKSIGERFPGADMTYSIEGMMQDGKALQAATSHYLGQNFSKAAGIRFLDEGGELQYGYTTSWGMSTRMIGGLVMSHGDDDGLRVPPKLAPKQVIILPVIPKDEHRNEVLEYCRELEKDIAALSYDDEKVRVSIDARDIRGGEKSWQWVKRGAPLRIEVGPRDIAEQKAVLYRRDQGPKDKEFCEKRALINRIPALLQEVHENLFQQAAQFRDQHIRTDITSAAQLREYFTDGDEDSLKGFIRAPWCEEQETEATLAEMKLSVRCIPLQQEQGGTCILTGKKAEREAIISRAY